ncbi:MAG TPA: hypothetical protein VL475_02820 [Planctomycetaceae bacterium]|jgi:hypothetical protein|nr:hypothetical protein [Planctomycetaceae bacterium]
MAEQFDLPANDNPSSEEWMTIVEQIRQQSADRETVARVTARALAAAPPERFATQPLRRPRRRTLVAAALLVMGGLSATLLLHSLLASPMAFAEVQEQVARSRSVQYVEVLTDRGAREELERMEKRRQELAQVLKRATGDRQAELQKWDAEIARQIENYRNSLKKGERIVKRRVQILGRYRQRTEMQDHLGKRTIHIVNTLSPPSIMLEPEAKRCVVRKTQTTINIKTGEKATREIEAEADRTVDFYSQMKVPDKGTSYLGEKELDGKKLAGFVSVEKRDSETWTRTYWVDPQTKLPRRIESEWRDSKGQIADWIRDDIVFDKELDPALFSTEPPVGYAVVEGGFVSLEKAGER